MLTWEEGVKKQKKLNINKCRGAYFLRCVGARVTVENKTKFLVQEQLRVCNADDNKVMGTDGVVREYMSDYLEKGKDRDRFIWVIRTKPENCYMRLARGKFDTESTQTGIAPEYYNTLIQVRHTIYTISLMHIYHTSLPQCHARICFLYTMFTVTGLEDDSGRAEYRTFWI
jgi:hypothetical protein